MVFERQGSKMGSTEILSYKIGDNVIYKNNGICRIADIKTMNFTGGDKLYYVLEPVYSKGSHTYVPTDLQGISASMRPLLEKSQIDSVIRDSLTAELPWHSETKQRAVLLNDVVSTLDRVKILAVFLRLQAYKAELEGNRKKMYASDLKLLMQTEKMIRDEFAFVLGIAREDVIPYVMAQISQ